MPCRHESLSKRSRPLAGALSSHAAIQLTMFVFAVPVEGIEPSLGLIKSQLHHRLCVTGRACFAEPLVGVEPTAFRLRNGCSGH